MDVRQLNALLAVDEHGGFSAAADALHTVQSNVSAHIARLERELGVTLVDRQAGRLTHEGTVVASRAQRVRYELDGVVADLAALRDEIVGTVRLGVIGSTARWLVPRLLTAVSERQRGIRLVVVDATSASLEPRLLSGSLDLAVVNLPLPGRDLSSEELFSEDLVLVVPAGHPLAQRRRVEFADLSSVGLLMPPTGTAFRGELDAAAAASGLLLHPIAEVDGVRLIASLATEGHGPAIVPATAILGSRDHRGWEVLVVNGLPPRRVGVAQRRRGLPAAPARAVLDLLRDVTRAADDLTGLHPLNGGRAAPTPGHGT
jgi:LysR family hydrogen peroxide-inducible transcriptional activator